MTLPIEIDAKKLVTVEIMGKTYRVPDGLTMLQAMWYTGHEIVRGAGCLGGVCGACGTTYRTRDDVRLKTCLACQTKVEDGMSFSISFAYYPNRKVSYQFEEVKDPKQDLLRFYPEAALCRNCNACTEACPQGIDVRDGVWRMVFGEFQKVSEMFMDCVMCGLCIPVCIADIAPNHVAVYASRAQGIFFAPMPENLSLRLSEIEAGKYDDQWEGILKMSDEELKTESLKS
jgi:ferredoxin